MFPRGRRGESIDCRRAGARAGDKRGEMGIWDVEDDVKPLGEDIGALTRVVGDRARTGIGLPDKRGVDTRVSKGGDFEETRTS